MSSHISDCTQASLEYYLIKWKNRYDHDNRLMNKNNELKLD